MILWKWKALDKEGNIYRGVWEDNLVSSVVSQLRKQDLYPINIKRSNYSFLWLKLNSSRSKIYWARTSRKIGILLEAGIPILTILDIIAEKETNPLRKNRWLKVSQRVLAGKDLSASLEGFTPSPGFILESLIRAGERSGTLAKSFLDGADQMEEEYYFEQKVKTALFYPSLLLIIALIVIYTLSMVILPMYETLFQGLDAEVPLLTKALIKVGASIPFLCGLLLVGLIGRFLVRKEHPWVIPGTAQIRRYRDIRQFCALLGRLLNAGLPLLDSLSLLRQISKERRLLQLLTELELAVKEGKPLSPAILKHGFFPTEAAKMLEIAEETGKLSEMLVHMAAMFRQELEEKLERYTRFLEPVLVLGMAGLIGLVAIGVLLPIFDVSMHIR